MIVVKQLSPDAYWRIAIACVECPACGAHRGEPCHNPESGKEWRGSLHSDRRNRLTSWRKRYPEQYEDLKQQLWKFADPDEEPVTLAISGKHWMALGGEPR